MQDNDRSAEFRQDLDLLLTEISELLQATEVNLVELEKAPGDTSIIQEVFRVMHTIKGGAATLGLQEAVEVTHRMETLMDGVRSGERQMSKPVMDTLFAVLDWLKEWRASMLAGAASPSTADILSVIESLGEAADLGASSVPDAQARLDLGAPEGLLRKIEAAVQQGKNVFRAVVRFGADVPLLSVRCFQIVTNIEETAEVVGSIPSMDQIESDQVKDVLEVYFTSESTGEDVAAIARANQDVVDVTVSALQAKAVKPQEAREPRRPARAL
jgi:two-component system chemotaxis sensor kinase CheA